MSGLGGLNKSKNGVVLGLVQLQLPNIVTRADLKAQAERVAGLVGKARRSYPTMDLVVFPEYSLHGLSMDTNPEIMCALDGPEVALLRAACSAHKIWGCFSLMERNPRGNPYNSGIIVDADGNIKLYYRKLHPWVPVEPWEPGNLGIPVCDGPNGSKLALIICHDGMFPEMARECAYKGAEIMIRTAGYTAPIRHAWQITNQANAFQNLMVTASVCMCGSDGTFDSMGEAMIVGFDGVPIAQGGGRADEIVCAEVRPDLVREARRTWGVENNIYQFGHRGYVAVRGGARDCPYTYMKDLVAERYELPWESEVEHVDGSSCGFTKPTRDYVRAGISFDSPRGESAPGKVALAPSSPLRSGLRLRADAREVAALDRRSVVVADALARPALARVHRVRAYALLQHARGSFDGDRPVRAWRRVVVVEVHAGSIVLDRARRRRATPTRVARVRRFP